MGIDSWGVDFGLLDEAGALLANPLSYRDGRGAEFMREALERVPAEELYATTGIQFLPINTLYQLLALESTASVERASTLLLMPDLLAYWLTGVRGAEATNASTTQLLDARSGEWAYALIERLGLPARIFPPVVQPGIDPRRHPSPGCRRARVCRTGRPIVAVASHDTASAVVAAPLAGQRSAFISSGTWSLVGVELDGAGASRPRRAGPTSRTSGASTGGPGC